MNRGTVRRVIGRIVLPAVLALLLVIVVPGASASSVLVTVQAESLTLPAGATIISDPGASGGKAVRMTAPNSALTGQFSFSGTATSVAVYAHGTKCSGGYPYVALTIDGATALPSTKVTATKWTAYSATVNIAGGTHTLAVKDLATNPCRVLFVDQIVLSGTTSPPPAVNLVANPASVQSGGSSTLTWSSSNASSCTATGAWSGSQPLNGSYTTGPLTSASTYTLTCTGSGGSAQMSVTVTVSASPPPTVSLSANPTSVQSGGSSALTWSSSNASSCTASGAWSGSEPLNGSYSTGPLASTSTYTLSCTGPGGSTSQSVTVTVSQPFNGLHVVGNKIQNGAGQTVVIHGVNKSGTEYACIQGWGIFSPAGSDSLQAVLNMKAWTGLNAVRIPLNEDCWLGINGSPPAYSGAVYQTAIENYVSLLTSNGLIAVLDLHWNAPGTAQATGQQPMADADHAPAFWQSVATAFKNQGSVVFDLFNEPYPDSNQDTTAAWTCWRDGGTCNGVSYQSAGMQQLVNTVRGTGAQNLILLGGVEYANSLTSWLAYEPTDPAGNTAAAWHMYGGNVCSNLQCWNGAPANVAAHVPLVAGEFGENYSGSDCTTSLVSSFTNWMDGIGAGYMAWTWNHWGSCLDLVTDEIAGTPTSGWGTFYKGHLASLG